VDKTLFSEAPKTETALRLERIRAGYGKKEILRGLSLAVQAGEIVALIGANGAGKSTLLKVAIGLLPPWEGSVYWDGRDITRQPVHERVRMGIAYLIQGGEVFPSLSVKENLEMGVLALSKSQREEAIEMVVSLFPALRDNWSRRAGLLSGGQRQALALGMVLCQRPKVLLLDEPSAGLAPKWAQDILSKVQELNQRLGITVLLVEQRVREALSTAHRAVVLVGGEIALETRHPEELLTSGELEMFLLSSPKENPSESPSPEEAIHDYVKELEISRQESVT